MLFCMHRFPSFRASKMPSLRSTLLPLVACLIGSRHAALAAPVTTRAEQLEAEWKLVQSMDLQPLIDKYLKTINAVKAANADPSSENDEATYKFVEKLAILRRDRLAQEAEFRYQWELKQPEVLKEWADELHDLSEELAATPAVGQVTTPPVGLLRTRTAISSCRRDQACRIQSSCELPTCNYGVSNGCQREIKAFTDRGFNADSACTRAAYADTNKCGGCHFATANLTSCASTTFTPDAECTRKAKIGSTPASKPFLDGCNLDGVDLRNVDLSAASMDSVSLRCADLRGAKLLSTTLTRADLSQAQLDNADLSNAVLTSSELVKVSFTGATLNKPDLAFTNLAGPVFRTPSRQLIYPPPASPAQLTLPPRQLICPPPLQALIFPTPRSRSLRSKRPISRPPCGRIPSCRRFNLMVQTSPLRDLTRQSST